MNLDEHSRDAHEGLLPKADDREICTELLESEVLVADKIDGIGSLHLGRVEFQSLFG
jgi:hypothetical protein